MNKIINVVLGALVVVALVVSVAAYQKQPTVLQGAVGQPGPQGLTGPRGPQGEQGPQGPAGRDGKDAVRLGAVSGPDIYSPYLNVNGVYHWNTSLPLQTATTTICAIQAPAATSTLSLFSLSETTSTTTVSIIDIAKATTAFATTTKLIPTVTLAANDKYGVAVTATSSLTTNNQAFTFAPNEWVVVKQNGAAGLTVSPVGKCQAQFISI